jgi:chemotaxis protein CheZ
VQHKVFRIEQTFAARRAATADARHANERREALGALIERRGVSTDNSLKHELAVVQDLIARHKHELAALINDGQERRMARAAGELGAAVDGMDKATQSILKSAESIDDSAKALAAALKSDYERALAQDIQDHVVQVYEACNFQDLTGQRIGKVIELLCTVEAQLTAMLTHCDDHAVSPGAAAKPAASRGLINGPKLDGDSGHTSQHDIDKMFG